MIFHLLPAIEKIFFLIVLAIVFAKQLKTRAGKFFPALVLAVNLYFIMKGLVFSYLTYKLWSGNPISRFLIPPYKSLDYFSHYAFFHFFKSYWFSLVFFGTLFFLMKVANHFVKGRFFEENEPWIAGTGIFLVGWPANLVWFLSVIILGVFGHLAKIIFFRRSAKELFSLYYLWLPVAFIIILFSKFVVGLPIIKTLIV